MENLLISKRSVKQNENKGNKTKTIKNTVGWGVKAYETVMKNKIVIAVCFLFQGLSFIIKPNGTLEWDAKVFTGLSALYALTCAVVVITGDRKLPKKGKELAQGAYKSFWDDKHKQTSDAAAYRDKSEVIKRRSDDAVAHAKSLKARAKAESRSRLAKVRKYRSITASIYFTLFIVCALLFFFTNFTVHVAHILLGIVVAFEGVFTIVTVIKTRNTVKLRDKTITCFLSFLSVALGVLLILLPANTAAWLLRLVGALLMLKGAVELVVLFRNRDLISSGKDTIHEIMSIDFATAGESDDDKDIEKEKDGENDGEKDSDAENGGENDTETDTDTDTKTET